MHREELLFIASHWSIEQMNAYIQSLEKRVEETRALITELKKVRRRTRAPKDTGTRGGK
jgi:hypothetical protein